MPYDRDSFDRDYADDFDFDVSTQRDHETELKGEALRAFQKPKTTAGMPMSRRDVDALYDRSLRDAKSYVAKKRGDTRKPDPIELAIQAVASIAGGYGAGYLAQRFRTAGGPLPIGVVLGLVGHAATYKLLSGSAAGYGHALSTGMLTGAAAIAGAGHGALGAEKAAAHAPDASFFGQQQAQQTVTGPGVIPPTGQPDPQQMNGASRLSDLQNLAARYSRVA